MEYSYALPRHKKPNKEETMRVSPERKSLDIEAREVNYIMGALIQNYLFVTKNEDPVEIIFPMFPAVPHPRKPGVMIPIRWLPPTDPIAIEIAKDGSNIPEVTPEEEAVLDAKDKAAEEVKEQAEGIPAKHEIEGTPKEQVAEAEEIAKIEQEVTRVPKMPASGDIGPGTHPDGMGSRDAKMDRRIAGDLKEEPAVEEDKEIPTEIEKPTEQ